MRRPQTTIQILRDIEEVADYLMIELELSSEDYKELTAKTDRVLVWAQRMIRWHKSKTRNTGEKDVHTTF
jgi:hypothetical protein